MSMVREKAVSNFYDRIQRFDKIKSTEKPSHINLAGVGSGVERRAGAGAASLTALPTINSRDIDIRSNRSQHRSAGPQKAAGGAQADGWLELRKGFYTLLCPDGFLIIFRDGVLRDPVLN